MSIRMKFVWGFLLCIVVSAGIVSGISVWKLNELSGADFRQASGHQLQVTNRFISLFFQENISKLRFLSNLPLIPQTAGHFPNFSQTTQDTMYDTASLSPQARELFSNAEVYLKTLAYASAMSIQADKTGIGDDAVSVVSGNVTIYMPLAELVDIAKEMERLKKEEEKMHKEIERVEKKLSNQGFVAKAPAAVIEEEKAKGEKYRTMLAQIEERLAQMQQ